MREPSRFEVGLFFFSFSREGEDRTLTVFSPHRVLDSTVLPPIPTTGLTASDVPDLATRVRNQMLGALHEISVVSPGQPEEELPEITSREDSPPTPNPPDSASLDQEPSMDRMLEPTSGSSASIASSFGSSAVPSERGGETEEDEGMILVGRP